MADRIVDLSCYFASRNLAEELLRREGAGYFVRPEPDGLAFRLDERKLNAVLEQGQEQVRRLRSGSASRPQDLSLCRRLLRRELIHDLAVNLLRTGP